MLVEDELFIALDLQATIESVGFRVEGPCMTLTEAEAAIERFSAGFAAAVLDVQLADAAVFPAADRLTAAGVPIIFHSAHADASDLRRRYPHAEICPKPSAYDDFVAAMKRSVAA